MSDTEDSWYTTRDGNDADVSSTSGGGGHGRPSKSEPPTPRKTKGSGKPPKLNGFSYFMRTRRPDLEAAGKSFPNGWKDVAAALTEEWAALPENVKSSYRRGVKGTLSESATITGEKWEERKPQNGEAIFTPAAPGVFTMLPYYEVDPDDHRKNSFGISFNELKIVDTEGKRRHADHRTELRTNLIKEDPIRVNFITIKFTTYVDDNQDFFLPAEVGMSAFSIGAGIIDNFGTFIDTSEIPAGFGFAARDNCNKLWLPYPPFDNRLQNLKVLTQRMERFVKHNTFPPSPKLTVYCMPDDFKEVKGSFAWIYGQFDGTCPFEIFSFPQAMLMLTTSLSELQLPRFGGDRITYQEHLVASRLRRDAAGDRLNRGGLRSLTTGYMFDETEETRHSRTRGAGGRGRKLSEDLYNPPVEWIENEESSAPSQMGRGSGVPAETLVFHRTDIRGGLRQRHQTTEEASPSLQMTAGAVPPTKPTPAAPLHPYSASIASSSRSMRPVGVDVDEWNKVRAGCFMHERQVLDYLASFDLSFEHVMSCPWHMDPGADMAMPYCPLNVTNRLAYNMLDVLAPIAEVKLLLTYHVPGVGRDEGLEIRRREVMLRNWVLLIRSIDEFKYDKKSRVPYVVKGPKFTGIPK